MPEPTVNKILVDAAILHAIVTEAEKLKLAQKVRKFIVDKMTPDLMNQLQRRLSNIATRGYDTSPSSTRRTLYLTRYLRRLGVESGTQLATQLTRDLEALALREVAWVIKGFGRSIPIVVDYQTPAPALLKTVVSSRPFQGRVLKDWTSSWGRMATQKAQDQIMQGLVAGETVQQLTARVEATLPTLQYQAEAIATTATNHVLTQARELTYLENSNVVKGVMMVATLDHRTSEICISIDGDVYPVGEGPRPPFHFRCRTTTVPVVKSLKELGYSDKEFPESTRSSMNGQVSDKLTYPEWLKKQPQAIQDRVLGKKKAAQWRAGKIRIDRYSPTP